VSVPQFRFPEACFPIRYWEVNEHIVRSIHTRLADLVGAWLSNWSLLHDVRFWQTGPAVLVAAFDSN
jgi:hypothetical protein